MDDNALTQYEADKSRDEVISINEVFSIDEEALEKSGYKKLPQNVFERVSFALQGIPGQVAQKATEISANGAVEKLTKNAYKVVLKDGMHLANSKTLKGAYKGLVFSTQGNNLVTHADWIPISLEGNIVTNAPQLVLGIFNAMSMVTGQYFLSQINGKLENIQNGLHSIMDYLETEKRSQIRAIDMTLMNVYHNLGYIMENELERQTTAFELKNIKRDSLANILLLNSKIETTKGKFEKFSQGKEDELQQRFNKLKEDIPLYWCAVRSYIIAAVLETILTEMDAPEYLQYVNKDLAGKVHEYETTCKSLNNVIQAYIDNSEDLNKSKSIFGFGTGRNYYSLDNNAAIVETFSSLVAYGLDSYRVESSKRKKTRVQDMKNDFWTVCMNLSPLRYSIDVVDEYCNSRNKPIELVCTRDAAYMKYIDGEEEK